MKQTQRSFPARMSQGGSRLLIGLALGLIYWITDSIIESVVYHNRDFFGLLLRPDFHESWHRWTMLLFMLVFASGYHIIFSKREQTENALTQRNKELTALNAVAATVSQSLDLDQILNDALEQVQQLDIVGSQVQSIIFLQDKQSGALKPAAHRGTPPNHPCLERPPKVGECLCGTAVAQGQVLLSHNCHQDDCPPRRLETPYQKDICLPLKVRGKTLGVMNVRLPVTQTISDSDIRLLTAITDQISVAIENARLFTAVTRQRERMRRLSIRLAETEEAERRRIANELHDQVGQNLTALGINLNLVRAMAEQEPGNNACARLDDSLTLVEQTTARIRNVMEELRPPMLDDYGLMAALRWYAERFAQRTELEITVLGEEPLPGLDDNTENALFRITQEALNNVAKHAQASQVTISLIDDADCVRLTIEDDGVGFAANGKNGGPGWGKFIMAERAEAVNGRFHTESQPQKGTKVITEIRR